jgi:GT2 family glycosyltransferase
MTGRSLAACHAVQACELRLFYNNRLGLSTVYNQAIQEAGNSNRILVFVHDDVMFLDYHWQTRIAQSLTQFDLVGIAGNTRRIPNQAGWIMLNSSMQLDSADNLSGAIGQGTEYPPPRVDVFGPTGQACVLLDGVLLAARSDRLHESGLRFDPQFEWHFYDMDFCRTAETLGMTMGTVDVSLVHGSLGKIDSAWHDSYKHYLDKWGS